VMRCAASYHRGEQPGQRVHVGRGAHESVSFLRSGWVSFFFCTSGQRCCCWADITASSRVPGGDASQCADAEPLWELHIVCCFGCHVFLPTTARRLANVPTAAEDAQLLK
jgi:hypothetical protein